MADHHSTMANVPGTKLWHVARPLRPTGWLLRRQIERDCRKRTNHCWHPEGMIDWWCCMCSGETEGMPGQQCMHCVGEDPSHVR